MKVWVAILQSEESMEWNHYIVAVSELSLKQALREWAKDNEYFDEVAYATPLVLAGGLTEYVEALADWDSGWHMHFSEIEVAGS